MQLRVVSGRSVVPWQLPTSHLLADRSRISKAEPQLNGSWRDSSLGLLNCACKCCQHIGNGRSFVGCSPQQDSQAALSNQTTFHCASGNRAKCPPLQSSRYRLACCLADPYMSVAERHSAAAYDMEAGTGQIKWNAGFSVEGASLPPDAFVDQASFSSSVR